MDETRSNEIDRRLEGLGRRARIARYVAEERERPASQTQEDARRTLARYGLEQWTDRIRLARTWARETARPQAERESLRQITDDIILCKLRLEIAVTDEEWRNAHLWEAALRRSMTDLLALTDPARQLNDARGERLAFGTQQQQTDIINRLGVLRTASPAGIISEALLRPQRGNAGPPWVAIIEGREVARISMDAARFPVTPNTTYDRSPIVVSDMRGRELRRCGTPYDLVVEGANAIFSAAFAERGPARSTLERVDRGQLMIGNPADRIMIRSGVGQGGQVMLLFSSDVWEAASDAVQSVRFLSLPSETTHVREVSATRYEVHGLTGKLGDLDVSVTGGVLRASCTIGGRTESLSARRKAK